MTDSRKITIGAVCALAVVVGAVIVWRLGDSTGGSSPAPTTADAAVVTTGAPPTTGTTFLAAVRRPEPPPPTERNPVSWPFAADSIWNVPLGREGRRVPAGLAMPAKGIAVDEDILVLAPTAPKVDILAHDAGWDPNQNRCTKLTGSVLYPAVPIPTDFVTDPGFLGATPNHAAAVLLADGDTIIQTQPFHRCSAGGPAVSEYRYAQDSLRTGNGIAGAHGGSQLSSLGGAIRVGELVPGGALRHALKVNVDCATTCSYNPTDPDGSPGFRWPALSADFDAAVHYRGAVGALQMGALLALPPAFDAEGLRTEPGRMVARALMRYGAYVVDDTHYPVFAFTTEWGPNGRVIDEFQKAWGFPLQHAAEPGCSDDSAGCAWTRDLADVLAALQVVDDNGPSTIGGAGARLAPCAPPFSGGAAASLPAGCPTR